MNFQSKRFTFTLRTAYILTKLTAIVKIFLKLEDNIRYLGIYIDSNLKWKIHIDNMIIKIRKTVYKFRLLRNILDAKNLKTMYFSLVQSIIQYGIIGWGGTYDHFILPLEMLQKRILKIVMRKPILYSSFLLFSENQIFTIRQLYLNKIAIYYFKHPSHFSKIEHPHSTRSKANLNVIVPKMTKSITQRHAHFIGPVLFNKFPLCLKTRAISDFLFRKKIKTWILDMTPQLFYDIIHK